MTQLPLFADNPHLALIFFIVVSLSVTLLGLALLFRVLSYLQKQRKSPILLIILQQLKQPLYFFIPLVVLSAFTPILSLKGPLVLVSNILQALAIVFFTWLLLKLVSVGGAILEHRCSQHELSNKYRTLKTQIRFISRILSFAVLVIMVALFLMTFDNARRLGVGLLTSAGIASVIIGFAAQKTLGSVFAGMQIAFNRMLRIGDGVTVEGVWGQVEEITLTHVIVLQLDNRRLIVPINYFMERPYQNWTLASSELISEVTLNVDYSVDLNALRQALDEIVEGHPLWDGKIKTMQVTDMTDKCMIVRVVLSGRSATAVTDLCCVVREKLIAYLYHHFPTALPRLRSETTTRPATS